MPRPELSSEEQEIIRSNRFATERFFRGLAGTAGDELEEQAQELAFQAQEVGDPREAHRLAQRALALDPGCVDALVTLAALESKSTVECAARLQEAVDCATRRLGEDCFREERGHFWGLVDTRPYMRARLDLAFALWELGREREAADHLREMLALNPNDNQGVRHVLLGWLLAMGEAEATRSLFEAYEGDVLGSFQWARVLERWLAGDEIGADQALALARAANPHAEAFLSGVQELPRTAPEYVQPGSPGEALAIASEIGPAWVRHPGARAWLRRVASA